MELIGYSVAIASPIERELMVRRLREQKKPLLILNTCQRLECYGAESALADKVDEKWENANAFERLARIAAGVESRMLGELEILGQVRDAYKQFLDIGGKGHEDLDRVFQDALALARKARRKSGIDSNLTSLASLAARELLNRIPEGEPVAVIGAGSVARSVTNYLKKRGNSPIRVISRCPQKAMTLAMSCGGFGGGLDDVSHHLKDVAGIISATAAPHPVLYNQHLSEAKRPLTIVDLATPPDCHEDIAKDASISYLDLKAIEAKAEKNISERQQQAVVAASIIREGAAAWHAKRRVCSVA